jgi:uncharacterized coiled-coil DUF342 family protein
VAFVLAFVLTMAFLGCAQRPGDPAAAARATRLQEEVRTLSAVRDQLRQDLKAVQAERDRFKDEVHQLRGIVRERDDLKHQLAQRTAERDQHQANLEQLHRGLKALLSQSEAALNPSQAPAAVSSASE